MEPEPMLVITLTAALLAIMALGFQVFSAAPGRAENRAFAVFAWIMALWILNDLAFWGFHGPDDDGAAWAQAAFLIGMAMQSAFLWFSWLYPVPSPVVRSRLVVLVVTTIAMTGVVLSGRAMGPVGFHDGRFALSFTPWTFVVGGYIYTLFLLGRFRLAASRARIANPAQQRQLDLVLGAPTLTGILTTVAIVVLPLAGNYRLLPYSSLGILVGTIVHGYAISSFRFLSPESVLDRVRLFPVTAKVAIATAFAFLVAVAFVLGVARVALGPTPDPSAWTQALAFGLAAASLPAMALILVAQRLVTEPLRRITEAAFEVAGGRTDVRVAMTSQDEVGVLGGAFNEMVERLEHDLHTLRDLSEGLLRTERLATAGALAAGVAHEVNNPLATVSSLVQTARARVEDPRVRELLGQAIDEMERIATVLRDLMDLARPRPAARRPCAPNDVVDAAIRILRYDRRFRGVAIEARLSPDLPALEAADPDRLQQVLLNLLLNARDAIDGLPDGRIVVTTDRNDDGGGVTIEIADSGRGISPADLARVTEPFFTTKAPGTGTGLGLAVCRDIVRDHGGTLRIASEAGAGTRVTIDIPTTGMPPVAKAASDA
jgi:signal transduction histidine kinase